MLTYSFNSQHPRVKNLPKGLPSGRIGSTYQKKKVIIIITVIIMPTKRTPFWPNRFHVPKKKVIIIIITVINKAMYLKHW